MKRAIAALLALVLALGVVAPTWAEETEEESTAPQATGETYDAGEDTAAPMMMLAAQSAAATAVSTGLDCTKGVAAGKIEEKFADYVNHAMKYYIDNVSELKKGKPILFFFEGVSAEANSDYKSDDYSKKSATRTAAVCLAVKFENETPVIYYCENKCSTIPDMPLDFGCKSRTSSKDDTGWGPSTLRDGVYATRLDNKDGKSSEYAVVNIDPSVNLYDNGTKNNLQLSDSNDYSFGTISRPQDSKNRYDIHGRGKKTTKTTNDTWVWSSGCILVGGSYSEFTKFMNGVTEINLPTKGTQGKPRDFADSEIGDFGYVVIDRYQYISELESIYSGKGKYKKGKNKVETDFEVTPAKAAKAISELCVTSLAVKEEVDKQPACSYASHEAGATLADGTSQYKTIQKFAGVQWVAVCKECGKVYDFMASLETKGVAGVYKATKTTAKGEFDTPYDPADGTNYVGSLAVGNTYTIVGSAVNAYGNTWYYTSKGRWIYSENITKVSELPAPTNFRVTRASETTATVSWSPCQDATSYVVAYSTPTKDWTTDADYKTGTSYTTTKLGQKTYTFRVRAVYEVHDGGTKVQSDWVTYSYDHSATTPCTTHVKGAYQYFGKAHPHYNYYKCSVCGEIFLVTSETNYYASCTQCNPPACANASHTAGAKQNDGTSWYETVKKNGAWVAACKGCGAAYDYKASLDTGDAGVYEVVDATGDGLCSAPYKEASTLCLVKGNKVTVTGSVTNAYGNKWMQTADGWIYSGKLKRAENAPTIVNSGYCGGEGDGKNLSWTLDSEGLLTISGRGKMADYDYSAPWKDSNVKKISISDGVISIGDDAFEHCRNLVNISIPNSVGWIGSNAFGFCESLTDIVIPDSIFWIYECVFQNCINLTQITIPASVVLIENYAFFGCDRLRDVYYGGSSYEWNKININATNQTLSSATIHFNSVPESVKKPTVTAAGTKQEVKAGADGKMAITVPNVVNNKAATVTFDQAAVENISGYGDMTLTVKDNTANLSGILKNSAEVKGKNAASIIVTLTKADGTPVFTEGTSAGEAVITIPYKTGLVSEKIKVFYVNGERLTSQAFTYNALTGVVTLKLAHFSEYLIVSESEGAPTPTPTPEPTPTPGPTPTPAPTPNPTPTPGTGTTTPSHGQATASGTAGAKKASAETLDPGVGVYAVTAVLSLTGMAWIRRKRR